MTQLDVDRSTVVEADELDRVQNLLQRWGVESTPDDFDGRWDVDRSGTVEDDELAPVAQTLLHRRVGR